MAGITYEHHGHEHEGALEPHTHLTSVGIDIGSSTSHLMFSRLLSGYPSAHQRKPVVRERRVIARSEILPTPFSGEWNIEAGPLRELIEGTYRRAGLSRDEIDTGAVIITGAAARRDNAQKIAELFSDEAGRFVCATAGPVLETIMAAHGSGAVLKSRKEGLTLLNIDIGGGTTKISIIEEGRIRGGSAIHIGARLLAYDGAGALIRLETGGWRFLAAAGEKLDLGRLVSEDLRLRLAGQMAQALLDVIDGGEPPWPGFYVVIKSLAFGA